MVSLVNVLKDHLPQIRFSKIFLGVKLKSSLTTTSIIVVTTAIYFTSRKVKIRKFPDVFNGRRIYGRCTPPLKTFLISEFVLQDAKKCYQNYLRHLWLKFFIFQMSGRWFPWHPKGVVHLSINPKVFFQTYWPRQVG